MATLVVGASGATGKLLVEQLLEAGQKVKIIVRSTSNIPNHWNNHEKLTIIKGIISEISTDEISTHLVDCQSVACCLGHNLTFRGIYGKPRKLVTDSVKLICEAILKNTPAKPIKIVLMNTTGNSNRDINEPVSAGQTIVLALLRLLLPPHTDNEQAADYLRVKVGQNNPYIEWTTVRPDTLINEEKVTVYTLHKSPTRDALFNPGKTSRINVAHLMARLILDVHLWNTWKGQMPVIYNDSSQT
ncbi:MAG: SDR family oxidoreductase [Desulfobulbaceae bacterium]|nr:SDR family oxidoreductase [Candidatus Kapabacteria bacterium]MBS4000696.1 SDR family oxidoreductase [Desulfobulbaceae bacterium]MBS4001337.1 SDR family oxidoreductase [Desulfobulbaceae bacterium]